VSPSKQRGFVGYVSLDGCAGFLNRLTDLTVITGLTVLLAVPSQAANWFVRPNGGAYGAENGTDWNNAFDGFADIAWAGINPGDMIWVAGGTYTQDLVPGKSGTSGSRVAIQRARGDSSACAGASGWNPSFDSTIHQTRSGITFNSFNFVTVSGRTTAAGGSNGWWIDFQGATSGTGIEWPNDSTGSSILAEYIDIQGPGHITYSNDGRGVDATPFSSAANNTFSHVAIFGWESGVYNVGIDGTVFEYLDMYDIGAVNSAQFHPNGIYTSGANGLTVRYSRFHRGPGGYGIGEGIFVEQSGGVSNLSIYGNVFYDIDTKTIQITGNTSAVKIFNNTFDNAAAAIQIRTDQGGACSGSSETRNNLFLQASADACGTMSNNLTLSAGNVFTNRATHDYHIAATVGSGFPRDAGAALTANGFYEKDADGTTRGADGNWDVGAYEFGSLAAPPANTFYIRSGATGTSCADWGANACSQLPATLIRGATYYVASGTYARRTFNTVESGTQIITIKGATTADHGTMTGWQNTYSVETSQAHFADGSVFNSSNWVFDGAVGSGSAASAYGFTIDKPASCSSDYASIVIGATIGITLTNLTITHVAFVACPQDIQKDGIFQYTQTDSWSDSTVSHCLFDGFQGAIAFEGQGATDANQVFEYNVLRNAFSSPTHHGEQLNADGNSLTNLIVRYNDFGRCTGTACIVANNSPILGADVYGNLFGNSDAGNGIVTATSAMYLKNVRVYNNTFYGNTGGPWFAGCLGNCANATGNVAYNNIVWNMSAAIGDGVSTHDYNSFFQASNVPSESHGQTSAFNPFLNSSGGNFHLTAATSAGLSLPSPYNVDADGNNRGSDGNWDRGAFEYLSGAGTSACDVNSDNMTNVADVQQSVNQAIGKAACATGDINKDGTCTVVDVQRDVNAALGGPCVTQ
jgi:hypothetical protein